MIRRTKTLIVFNIGAKTSDGKTSEECADAYALSRGYCGMSGQYWKIGVNFGGQSIFGQKSTQTALPLATLLCTKSFAPGQTPEIDNPRYTGQTMVKAIANMVEDGQLDAIFTESLVPNYPPQTGTQAPDGWIIALSPAIAAGLSFGGDRGRVTDRYSDLLHTLPNPTLGNWITNNRDVQLPYGRIGWAGCTFADIQRVVADANWGEQQNNLSKPHVVGGTGYTAGGDTAHMVLANQSFAKRMAPENLGAFDQDGAYKNKQLPGTGFGVSYAAFNGGTLTPPLSLFGLLFSINPNVDWSKLDANRQGKLLNQDCWKPQRGGWAFNWCSGASAVGYDALRRGATAGIMCEHEPYTSGLPAVDCVAEALLRGLTMAEANFLSDQMQVANCSVYGAPDYAPYLNKATERRVAQRRKLTGRRLGDV